MSSHSECQHAQTPQARRTCRDVRKVVEQAERWGLAAEVQVGEYSRPEEAIQVLFQNMADPSFRRTKVLLTRGYDSTRTYVTIMQAGATKDRKGMRELEAWLWTISDQWRNYG